MMKHKLLITFILVMFLIPVMAMAKTDKLSAVKTLPSADNTFIVPIEVENTQDLVALDIPLKWSEGAELTEVVFTDRVKQMQFKHADIDNENHQVIIGMISMVDTQAPDLATGSGIVAELHFRLNPGVDDIELQSFETQRPSHSLTYYYNDYSTGRPEVKEVKPELDFARLSTPQGGSAVPTSYELKQNWPNPFNPTTTISYSLPEPGDVMVAVYNILGQQVRVLASGHQEAGSYEVTWDGKDASGSQVASGVYFYRARLNNYSETHKMVLLK